jgi:DNA-directed RNA polymerase subunit RPC12/RpoP
MDYYREVKWCRDCRKYVNYLQSMEGSYCSQCGSRVFILRDDELARFRESMGLTSGVGRLRGTTLAATQEAG